jgi:hypothetical protein
MLNMKLIYFFVFALFACSKQVDRPAACGYAFAKYYQNPPADTTLANRTYWVRVASDTVILPPPAPPITNWVVQVTKPVYDTMLLSGKNAVLFCY